MTTPQVQLFTYIKQFMLINLFYKCICIFKKIKLNCFSLAMRLWMVLIGRFKAQINVVILLFLIQPKLLRTQALRSSLIYWNTKHCACRLRSTLTSTASLPRTSTSNGMTDARHVIVMWFHTADCVCKWMPSVQFCLAQVNVFLQWLVKRIYEGTHLCNTCRNTHMPPV